jgi:hypothetical protein
MAALPPAFLYSTGWMVEAELSGDDATNGKAAAEKEGTQKWKSGIIRGILVWVD